MPDVRAALLADYEAGMSQHAAAKKHGVAKSTAHGWVKEAGISRSLSEAKDVELSGLRARKAADAEAEVALTGGRWVRRGLVMRWEPFIAPSKRDLSDRERRIEWEDAMFDEDEARDLHARYFNGCREPRTVVGERVYQRRKKRTQTARKKAA